MMFSSHPVIELSDARRAAKRVLEQMAKLATSCANLSHQAIVKLNARQIRDCDWKHLIDKTMTTSGTSVRDKVR